MRMDKYDVHHLSIYIYVKEKKWWFCKIYIEEIVQEINIKYQYTSIYGCGEMIDHDADYGINYIIMYV